MNTKLGSWYRWWFLITPVYVQHCQSSYDVTSMSWSFLGTGNGNTRRRASSSSVSQAEAISGGKEFNEQVMLRVVERLNEYMTAPIEACERLLEFRSMNAFQYGMTAPDYKLIFQYLYMELKEKSLLQQTGSSSESNPSSSITTTSNVLYFGLEDGTFFYFYDNMLWAQYREPGNDGYIVSEKEDYANRHSDETTTDILSLSILTRDNPNYKYYNACIDSTTGAPSKCVMSTGSSYVHCVNDCELIPCLVEGNINDYVENRPNDKGTGNISTSSTSDNDNDNKSKAHIQLLCPNYVIKQVTEEESVVRGYIPSTDMCINVHGQPEERPGFVLVSVTGETDDTNEGISSITENDDTKDDMETGFYESQWMQKDGKRVLGNCYYGDQKTLVNRSDVVGPYAQCNPDSMSSNNTNEPVCNEVFTGGFVSYEYDGRYRDWYMLAKRYQRPIWTEPYPFFALNSMGITYSRPIYSRIKNRTSDMDSDNNTEYDSDVVVFTGVVSVDYRLEQINTFLTNNYGGTDMQVLIVERVEPYYLIANSRYGAPVTTMVLVQTDPEDGTETTIPCPAGELGEEGVIGSDNECVPARITIDDLRYSTNVLDVVSYRSFVAHKERNFPESYYKLPVKESDAIGSNAFVAQGNSYNLRAFTEGQSKSKLSSTSSDATDSNNWHVFVIVPMDRSTTDAALPGTSTFVIVIILGTFGFIGCTIALITLYSKRKEKAMVHSDWRFTCFFIAGCAAINLSTYTLLGENTDQNCMLRMWSFNGLFACALSPLFVKVWRMADLLGATHGFQRKAMNNCRAFLYTLPLVVVQLFILAIFSIVDPPRQTEILGAGSAVVSPNENAIKENSGSGGGTVGYQEVTCTQQTNAFLITQLVYDALLVSIGCILAYETRDLDPKFGEAKQLGFSMYNVAFTGIVVVATVNLVELDHSSKIILQAVGVFWASFFCSFAFVLPRLLEVRKENRNKGRGNGGTVGFQTTASGLHQVLAPVQTSSKKSGDDSKKSPRLAELLAAERSRAAARKSNNKDKNTNNSLIDTRSSVGAASSVGIPFPFATWESHVEQSETEIVGLTVPETSVVNKNVQEIENVAASNDTQAASSSLQQLPLDVQQHLSNDALNSHEGRHTENEKEPAQESAKGYHSSAGYLNNIGKALDDIVDP